MDVGFIGLGRLGRPMAERLLAAGHTVHAFNRSRAPVEALAAKGARPASSLADIAARADIVLTALPTEETVLAVYEELSRSARAEQLFLDHSTVSPDTSRRCASLLWARGARFLDAPVSGGPEGAAAGTLTIMVGGGAAAFERALPVLRAYGANIRRCGDVGAGEVVKLVNQLLTTIHALAAAEAMVLTAKLGADPELVFEVISTSLGASAMFRRVVPLILARDFSGGAMIRLYVKDLAIARALARSAGAPLPLGELTEQRFREAAARGMADEDVAAMVRLWEEAAGVSVRGPAPGTPARRG